MSDGIRQQLIALLGAYGYNLYNDKNRARADDLLVRGQAADSLADAGNALRGLRTAYRSRFIPPATREQPTPPAERLAELAEMTRAQERLADLETGIRSMPVPPSDRVWERFRREGQLLNDLLLADYNLIVPCREVRDQAQSLTVDTWSAASAQTLRQLADRVEAAMRARSAFLHI